MSTRGIPCFPGGKGVEGEREEGQVFELVARNRAGTRQSGISNANRSRGRRIARLAEFLESWRREICGEQERGAVPIRSDR